VSKLTERLREIHIINPHDIVADGDPVVDYEPQASMYGSGWSLWVKGKPFKDQPWYTHGALKFIVYGRMDKERIKQKALDKCKELFPNIEMVKSPWRDIFVPKTALDRAMERLKVPNEPLRSEG